MRNSVTLRSNARKYDNLLLIDDDVEVDPRWVEELFKPIWTDPTWAQRWAVGQSANGDAHFVLANLSNTPAR